MRQDKAPGFASPRDTALEKLQEVYGLDDGTTEMPVDCQPGSRLQAADCRQADSSDNPSPESSSVLLRCSWT